MSALVERVRDDSSATLDLTAAAEAVVDRTTAGGADADPDAVADVRLRLVHVHLPKLVENGVVSFDSEDGVVRYRGDADVEAVLASLAGLRTD
ncbi:DUF7344 domain-containing protein [Halobaculum lipolyticum]|uniref:DUF7344 domain-containing protein n=1 Tax=Halobaculum lipolyticum TaxID=3032001 RepID=UPI003D80B8CF